MLTGPIGRLVVVGGGASGVFAAIAAARAAPMASGALSVTVLEQGGDTLRKLLASGGGRCNVMHAVKPPRELVRSYPRGERELLGPFSARFSPADTLQWFENEGVALKVEPDGRVFPTTDPRAAAGDRDERPGEGRRRGEGGGRTRFPGSLAARS